MRFSLSYKRVLAMGWGVSLILSLMAASQLPVMAGISLVFMMSILYLVVGWVVFRLQSEYKNKLKHTMATLHQEIERERAQRVAAFIQRDFDDSIPPQILILLTVPRSGSTWLMDMLRSHPSINLLPRALVFETLLLRGNRYPMGLTNGPNATTDFEISPGRGYRIPEFKISGLNVDTDSFSPYALEKMHPHFFYNDLSAFLAKVEALEAKPHQERIQFVYQVRSPQSVMASMLNYRRRDFSWMIPFSLHDLANVAQNAYQVIYECAQIRGGCMVDYQFLKADAENTLVQIFNQLWPNVPTELSDSLRAIAQAAQALTKRENRATAHQTPFLGEKEGRTNTQAAAAENQRFFERHAEEFAAMEESYQACVSLSKNATQ